MKHARLENKFDSQLHLQKAFKNKSNSYYKTQKQNST